MINSSNYRKYTSKNPIQKFLINNFLRTVFECLEGLSINSILDAGCGEGFILSEFNDRGIGRVLEGIDSSQESLNTGKELFPYLTLHQGDVYHLPYEDNSFDLVICTEVMEHLAEPDKVLNEIVRISGLYCLFSVPNEPAFMISNLLRGKNITRLGNDIEHLQHWSSRAFEKFVSRKLKILAVKKPFPWTVVLSKKRV
jgi:2-polyprenyl-3-methyl-5-hydroxy-6-metoxy-1,4-benzoquinol methylase